MSKLDFSGLAVTLLSRWSDFLPAWSPGGKLVGKEYMAGGLRGGPGDSFRFNIDTGKFADFATGEKGGDMITLYAKIEGIKNGESAKKLADQINYNLSDTPYKPVPVKVSTHEIGIPPVGVANPPMIHPSFGAPSGSWCYKSNAGNPIFWEARYDTPGGKQFSPWSWSLSAEKWVMKGFPSPRPLYGLDDLKERKNTPVMIVEGPKCVEAAKALAGNVYSVVTWPNGASSLNKADWAPVQGRRILIWPDADGPGREAATKITEILTPMCPEIKVLDVNDMPDKWDAADALKDGWTWEKLKEWAKPRAKTVVGPVAQASAIAINQNNIEIIVDETPDQSRSAIAILDEIGIPLNKSGQPTCNIDIVLRVFERYKPLHDFAWYDSFHRKIFTNWLGGTVREWDDHLTLELTKYLQRELGFQKLSDNTTYQALILYSREHPRNEPKDWMETLKWDGVPRVDTFFIDCFGASQTVYSLAASKNFFVGMVARIYKPGCKMDNMIVLEGSQGIYKSTALGLIGGKWFTETNESVTNKDFFSILHGKMIVEIAELHTFSRAEVTRIKQVISCQTDRYRQPYERLVADHARQSIFVGTTNEDSYLKDMTGNRRFWPVKCGSINTSLITETRDQVFAEAVHHFKAGSTWWEMPKDETENEQEFRRQVDEWETMISDHLTFSSIDETTVSSILGDCLKIEPQKMDQMIQRRVGTILKKLGWENNRRLENGVHRRTWKKKGVFTLY